MAKQQHGTNGKEPTPLEEWRKLRLFGALKTLRTGRVVRWRPVELLRALQQGKIPDNLSGFVANRVWTGQPNDERSNAEKAIDWQNYLDLMATLGLMEPDPAQLEPGDLLYDELSEIEETVTNPAKAVLPFPVQQGGHVDAGPESGEV